MEMLPYEFARFFDKNLPSATKRKHKEWADLYPRIIEDGLVWNVRQMLFGSAGLRKHP
jgi:hypothetical protein